MFHRNDDSRSTTTVMPGAAPTIRPTFDVDELARNSGFRSVSSLLSATVFEIVPDMSWREAKLDLVETEILSQIDGVSPLGLLESTAAISRDELYATVITLRARGFVREIEEAIEAPPCSGVQPCERGVRSLGADNGARRARVG